MFDITPDDIALLNDIDLRELVGRLCEAELRSRGLPVAAVTYGGHQAARDGGVDVRVELPENSSIEGFVPRPSTGFQVKKSDMSKAAIIGEMRPGAKVRPVIQELANERGAYIMVSSTGSTADSALQDRRAGLRAALSGADAASDLHTDFYDRTRLATWVRCHRGLIAWVKKKVGRALVGWHPYGSWSGSAEGVDAEYLVDDKARIHFRTHDSVPARAVTEAIDELRDVLVQSGKVVRLVGLSGVGKTRLAQALFDARIGSRSLPPSLAYYTNLSDDPDPQPTGLASELIANAERAILIVDNCPPDLHRRLTEVCGMQTSTLSVLTIEYDVRADDPEGTQVVTLDTSSLELIERLLRRRYEHLSEVDARTIAEASGGNARIAISLAETVDLSETIAGLSNDELFQRLFRQRQDVSDGLLRTAEACSLVYSFQGEALEGTGAELPRLAALAHQDVLETHRQVAELLRRDLMQQRGEWRAVLPHAIANRLATRALENIPYDLINQQLIDGGTERLARSFSRRLSFLHDHPKAIAIVKKWLAPGGRLGDLSVLNDFGRAMFENVAPVLPEAALVSLERSTNSSNAVLHRHLSLLRSLAYDPMLFERSTELLARAATHAVNDREAKTACDTFASLFTIYLSGTHATIEQRLKVVEKFLRSDAPKSRALGLAALHHVLETAQFNSVYAFEFGARSRDYGYRPRNESAVHQWYGAALCLIERLALTDGVLCGELRNVLAKNFRGLWTWAGLHDELEGIFLKFAAAGFWREGWIACRETMQFDKARLTPNIASRLNALEARIGPSNLRERVRGIVLGDRFGGLDLEDIDLEGNDVSGAIERLDAIARDLGVAVSNDEQAFADLLPELLKGGNRAWAFGRGLAGGSKDRRAVWATLVEGLERIGSEQRDPQVLRGFLAELWQSEGDLAQLLLDKALDQPALLTFLPSLHCAGTLDERGAERLGRALMTGRVPVWTYRHLAFGRVTEELAGPALRDLVLLIAESAEGFHVALEILFMRLHADQSAHRSYQPELLEAGRELLGRVIFRKHNHGDDYHLSGVVKACLAGPDDGPIAAAVTVRLKQAVAAYTTYAIDNHDLLQSLLDVQPAIVLDTLFGGDEADERTSIGILRETPHRSNPVDAVSCEELIGWCEMERDRRYPLAASIITFAGRSEVDNKPIWSEQAKALLTNAPDARRVLVAFIERFRPSTWSGSLAAAMEMNAPLLDIVESLVPAHLIPLVAEVKAQFAQMVTIARQQETAADRKRDERFE